MRKYLTSKGIGTALFYERSIPELKPFKNVKGETKNAIEFSSKCLCLPIHPFITEEEIKSHFISDNHHDISV